MSYTVFLGNLPVWVTADDIRSWLSAENLVADTIKVIRNPETQESKGFAFIDAPNSEEMQSIIRRFDRAPLEDRLLRANPAQPPRSKGQQPPSGIRSGPPRATPQHHHGRSGTISPERRLPAQLPLSNGPAASEADVNTNVQRRRRAAAALSPKNSPKPSSSGRFASFSSPALSRLSYSSREVISAVRWYNPDTGITGFHASDIYLSARLGVVLWTTYSSSALFLFCY